MAVTQLDNPNDASGKYTGYGKIIIPFMLNSTLLGKFENISVNEAMQVVEGDVEITTSGMDAWMENVAEQEANNEAVTEVNGIIDTIVINPNGTIVITTVDGETSTITNEAVTTSHNQIINDSAGNSYIITPNGNILVVPASINTIVKLALEEISNESPENISLSTSNLSTSQQAISQYNNINNVATNAQVTDNIIEEEDDNSLSPSQTQALQMAGQKMFTYKQQLLLKSKYLILKEFAQHYLSKKSYAEVAVYTIVQNQSLKDELLLKINQNETQQNMVTFAKDKISVFVEKIIEDKISGQ